MTANIAYTLTRLAFRFYTQLALTVSAQQLKAAPPGAKILAVNHPATVDLFYLTALWPEPISALADEALFTIPLLGMYMRQSKHIPVTPGNGTDAFHQARQRLDRGETILIFVEGNISPQPGKLHPFRSGATRLAMLTGAPIIPVGIYAPRKKPLGRCQNCYLWGAYGVTIGRPLYFSGAARNKARTAALTAQLRQTIEQLIRQSRRRIELGAEAR